METKYFKKNILKKSLVLLMTLSLFISIIHINTTNVVYAKDIGKKNDEACKNCQVVSEGTPPTGYTPIAGTAIGTSGKYSVYSGGNSRSKFGTINSETNKTLDDDPTDFAKPLPYGNVYIDASKLNWDNPSDFIIDIKDDRFKWVCTSKTLVDAGNSKSTNDPMGLGKPLTNTSGKDTRGIFYVGPLKSYLSDINSTVTEGGFTNTIKPKPNAQGKTPDYLYRITYLNAVTLPNGTLGHLVLTMKKVQIETSVTIDSTNYYELKDKNNKTYKYTNALLKVQGENQLGNDTGNELKDSEGNDVNQRNTYITDTKRIRNATGNILDLEINVIDIEGNAVKGTISYAAHDMDFESVQNIWGRPVGDKFAEGLTIVSGSQSYALVPDYAKLVNGEKVFYASDPNAKTRDTGWVPVGPGQNNLDRVLKITKTGSSDHADGVRFASPFLLNYRDANGTFNDSILNGSSNEVMSFQGDTAGANNNIILKKFGAGVNNPITDNAKKMLYEKLKDYVTKWEDVTAELAWEKLGYNSWKTYRNDDDSSFDSGFAVLLSSEKSELQWSGSRIMGSNLNTTLFDTTLFTYIEQTHGTGGGIYFETYDLLKNCKVNRSEGINTMGKGSNVTVTVVPEDGYRVKEIRIGNKGLANPTVYNIEDLALVAGTAKTVGDYIFELNEDGSVDVSIPNIQDPKHIHADFTNDYYFYKVWKKPQGSNVIIPNELKLKATPFVYEMKSVVLDGVNYTISEQGTEYTSSKGEVHEMSPNYTLTIKTGDTYKIWKLVGDKLVHGNEGDDDYQEEKITSEIKSGASKEFTISNSGSDVSGGYVTVEDKGNEVIWKVKYPAEGRTATSGTWPALPIETYNENEHNYNHVERNYWFVSETVPVGWSIMGYDNSKALAPGVVSAIDSKKTTDDDAENSFWAEQSEMYHDATQGLIKSQESNDHAFMSPLSSNNGKTGWGGEIANNPSIVIKAQKVWDDNNNENDLRQDIYFHLDAVVNGKTIEDYLPPYKIARNASGKDLVAIWGNGTAYASLNITDKIVGNASELKYKDGETELSYTPLKDRPGYVCSDGNIYFINELPLYDKDGNLIEYNIRETDKDGNSKIFGYESEVKGEWSKLDDDTETIGDVKVGAKKGTAKNTIKLIDFTVTKVWKENGAARNHPSEDDITKLKDAYTLMIGNKIADDKYQAKTAKAYDASKDTGILEVTTGTDAEGNNTTVFTWHKLPDADYSVIEDSFDGYELPVYENEDSSITDKAMNNSKIINEVKPPVGTPKETYGEKGKAQSTDANKLFEVTTETTLDGSPNKIEKIELLDENGNPTTSLKVEGGTYTISDDGTITFTPEPDFVGTPSPARLRATDSNGLATETTYTPHVVDVVKKVTRTIVYEYSNGDPVLDEEGKPLVITQVVEFGGTLNPETGELIFPSDSKGTMEEVPSGEINDYNVDKDKVGEAIVYPNSNDLFEKVIYSPKGIKAKADVTYGLPNEPQVGTPTFEMETHEYTDGTPNELTIKLIDPHTGKETDEKTVDAVDDEGNVVGTYTLNDDGTVTFNPNKDYVGNPKPLELQGTDRFGNTAKTTYTPHVVNPEQNALATRTIHYRYLTEDGEEVTGDDKQSVTLYKHAKKVDPKTGEVLEWGEWEPATFPSLNNPDDKVDGKIWYTDDNVDEQVVNEPGVLPDVYVIYEKIPYTVTYFDGDHGISDGKGNQNGEEYGNDVTGGNGITPNRGYHFTGKYSYIIKDHYGNIIGIGETDDPTSIEITGNIEFTPIYEPDHYTVKYDPNGGSGEMSSQEFTGADDTMSSKSNEFSRSGYEFKGFKLLDRDGNPILDENGNEIIIQNIEDLRDILLDLGDGGEVILQAIWQPVDPKVPVLNTSVK